MTITTPWLKMTKYECQICRNLFISGESRLFERFKDPVTKIAICQECTQQQKEKMKAIEEQRIVNEHKVTMLENDLSTAHDEIKTSQRCCDYFRKFAARKRV